ncbi:MAG: hypothetical protein ABR576_13040 [Thermoanaerobaculia bacterium]
MIERSRRAARASTLLALFLLFLGAAPAGGEAPPAERRGYCAINRVDGPLAPGGYAAATGFAVDLVQGAPVRKIEMLLDGAPAGEASLRGLRPDVMAHFARQDFLWSGWSGTISLEGRASGKHAFSAAAVLASGERVPCEGAPPEITVLAIEDPPDRPRGRLAAEILLRTAGVLLGFALLGWAAAAVLRLRPLALAAPLTGFCLFPVVAEWGAAARVRPFHATAAAVLLAIGALALLFRKDRQRLRPELRASAPTLLCVLIFAAVGVIPLASHGDGAVLGDIDDAVREASLAESITRFGWSVPEDVKGYFAVIPTAWRSVSVREGGAYLLSALAQRFRVPAHEVHATAMLAAGCFVVLAAGYLATVALGASRLAPFAPLLAALNSVLFATLYGQHLGSLFAAALMAAFAAFLLRMGSAATPHTPVSAALAAAAGLTLYPESMAAWAAAAVVLLAAAEAASRRMVLERLALAALLAVALNPVGLAKAARFALYNFEQSREMVSPYSRMVAGDTHYFPPLTVVAGIEAYRDDARAPAGALRRALIPATGLLILATAVLGWRGLPRSDRRTLAVLLVPPALALFANFRLGFPYGFAKFLPIAIPLWAVAFTLFFAGAALGRRGEPAPLRARMAAAAALALTLLLALPAVRHAVSRAVRAVPSYDAAMRVLPALARTLGRSAVLRVDEPLVARREWFGYFLGENAMEYEAAGGPVRRPDVPGPRYRLVDRRDPDVKLPGPAVVSSRYFAAAREEAP